MTRPPAVRTVRSSVSGVKCERCRGSSRPDQARPKSAAPSPPAFGTSTIKSPPGASQPTIRRTTAMGSTTCSSTWNAVTTSKRAAANGASSTSPTCSSSVNRRAFWAADSSTSIPVTCHPSARATPSPAPEPQPTSR